MLFFRQGCLQFSNSISGQKHFLPCDWTAEKPSMVPGMPSSIILNRVLGEWLIWKHHPTNDFNVCGTHAYCKRSNKCPLSNKRLLSIIRPPYAVKLVLNAPLENCPQILGNGKIEINQFINFTCFINISFCVLCHVQFLNKPSGPQSRFW